MKILRTVFAWVVGIAATIGCTTPSFALSLVPRWRIVGHRLAKLWASICVWATGCPLTVTGLDKLNHNGAYVLMVNHQSALDIPVLMSVIPANWRTVFWAKKSLFRIPFLGWAMKMLGHMPVDRENRGSAGRMLSASIGRAGGDRALLIFPEETYSMDGELLPFQRGGFVLALKTGLPVVPVGIHGTRDALPPGSNIIRHAPLRMRFGEPISTAELKIADRATLTEQTRSAIAELSKN